MVEAIWDLLCCFWCYITCVDQPTISVQIGDGECRLLMRDERLYHVENIITQL